MVSFSSKPTFHFPHLFFSFPVYTLVEALPVFLYIPHQIQPQLGFHFPNLILAWYNVSAVFLMGDLKLFAPLACFFFCVWGLSGAPVSSMQASCHLSLASCLSGWITLELGRGNTRLNAQTVLWKCRGWRRQERRKAERILLRQTVVMLETRVHMLTPAVTWCTTWRGLL